MKSLSLKPAEVRALLKDGRAEIRRAVKGDVYRRIPCERCDGMGSHSFSADHGCQGGGNSYVPDVAKCPYAVGARIAGKESWRHFDYDCVCGANIRYEVDGKSMWFAGRSLEVRPRPDRKQATSTMPLWAVRLHLIVESVRCERGDVWEWVWTIGREDAD